MKSQSSCISLMTKEIEHFSVSQQFELLLLRNQWFLGKVGIYLPQYSGRLFLDIYPKWCCIIPKGHLFHHVLCGSICNNRNWKLPVRDFAKTGCRRNATKITCRGWKSSLGRNKREGERERKAVMVWALLRVLDCWRHLVLYDTMAAGAELLTWGRLGEHLVLECGQVLTFLFFFIIKGEKIDRDTGVE